MSGPKIHTLGSLKQESNRGPYHRVGRAFKEEEEDYVEPVWNNYLNIKPNYRKLAIWAALQLLFAYIEFGSVFFILSILYFIYQTLGSHGNVNSKGERVQSAYSVFNPRFEKIAGTFDAEKQDKQIRSGFL